MATPIDNKELFDRLTGIHTGIELDKSLPIRSVLNVGVRDKNQRALVNTYGEMCGATVHTLDLDMGLDVSYVHDLNSEKRIPGPGFDMVICCQTLMYLDKPLDVIDRLLDATDRFLIVQDTIVRPRTETTATTDGKHIYTDQSRFTSMFNQKKREDSPRPMWDLSTKDFWTEKVYENPPGSGNYTGIWVWRK